MDTGRECERLLEEKIGYRFRCRPLLQGALTHKSFSNEQPGRSAPDNERLEFLGDAVLDLAISHWLFESFPDLPEGELTRIRAEVVSEPALAVVARRLDLGTCLQLGRGEERSGGREKDSLLADALEALLGAVFCDGGLPAVAPLIEPMFGERIADAVRRKTGVDFKTRLQEILQSRGGRPPDYHLVLAEGPDHQRLYTIEVLSNGEPLGRGCGRTKKAAEQEAARLALERLGG
jgi:ribonuclease-3